MVVLFVFVTLFRVVWVSLVEICLQAFFPCRLANSLFQLLFSRRVRCVEFPALDGLRLLRRSGDRSFVVALLDVHGWQLTFCSLCAHGDSDACRSVDNLRA